MTTRLTAQAVLEGYRENGFFDSAAINQMGSNGDTPLHVACIHESLEEVVALLEGGADVNIPGEEGYTPLHWAASGNLIDIARVLIKFGATDATQNSFGETAQDMAKKRGFTELAELLTIRTNPQDSGIG